MALRIRFSYALMSFWMMATISNAWRPVVFTMVVTTLHLSSNLPARRVSDPPKRMLCLYVLGCVSTTHACPQ